MVKNRNDILQNTHKTVDSQKQGGKGKKKKKSKPKTANFVASQLQPNPTEGNCDQLILCS